MKYSKILIFLGIGCVVGLLLIFGVRLQAQNWPKKDGIATKVNEMNAQSASKMEQFRNRQPGSNRDVQGRSESAKSNDGSDFYSVIVGNNLFRPLGWRPPNKEPEYTFIGTRIDPNGAMTEAYVLERRSNKFYLAQIGDKVGDAVVKGIKEKEIILDKNGKTITLRGGNMQFQSSGSRSGGSSPRGNMTAQNESSGNKKGSSASADKDAAKAKAAAEKARAQAMEKAQEMRRRFENASREDREQMIREFRERGRSRGRRGRDR